jgi:HD-like signal output (HDOD) protein
LNELLGTLTRIGELDAYLQDEKLRALVGRLSTLPSFPSTYVKIMRELAADDPDVENIADIIVKDPALTAKVLQVANSAAFGLSQRVSSPFEAVQFLGLATVRSIALAAHVFASFELASIKGFSARQIWDDALHCSQITRTIMQQEEADSGETEDACAAALLRNTGLLLLALNLPQQFQQVMTLTKEQGLSLLEAEEQIFGANHTGIAAYLFGLWGLSAPMVEAVAFHLQPTRSEVRSFSPLTAVHVAHVFTGETFPGKVPGMPAELNQDYLAAAGVDRRLELWRAETEKLFAKNA